MPVKTLKDCAEYPAIPVCSSHIPDGCWVHDAGVDPYRVVIDEDDKELGFI